MANKQLQLRRGTKTENAGFTGAVGEISAIINDSDRDTETLVLGNASAAGGVQMLRADLKNLGSNKLAASAQVDFADASGNTTVRLTNVADPQAAQDVATKAYVDSGGTDITLDELGGVAIAGDGETTLGDAQVLIYDNADSQFRNKSLSQDLTITHEGVVTIADDAVTSAKIADATIVEGNLADDAVTSAKIANATIVAGNIANDTITATQIAANAITASELADDAVDTAAIANAAVTNVKIADTTIANDKLVNSSITLKTTGTGADDTLSLGGDLNINGTANEVEVTLTDDTFTIGLPTNVTIAGNLTVSGTQTVVNSTTVSVADPVLELGDSGSDDNLDRGIKLKYNNSGEKIAFMGLDDTDQKFMLIADATDTSSVFSGSQATLKADLDGTVNTATQASITTCANLTTVGTITSGTWNATPIVTAYIANDAVTSAKIDDGTIVEANLADDAVTADKLASSAVVTASIVDDAVTFAKIQNISANSVLVNASSSEGAASAHGVADTQILIGNGNGFTSAALSSDVTMSNTGAVTISNDAVTAAKLADEAVVTANIVDGNVTTAKLAASAVATSKIEDAAVSTSKIANDAVTLAKMAGITRGSIIHGDSNGDPAALEKGSANTVLTSDGTDLSYSSVTSAMIADGAIVNADINASAAIAHSKLAAVTSAHILVGNGSNVPTAVAVSGDVSLANDGAVTIVDNAVETDMILDSNVTLAKIQNVAANSILVRDANSSGVLSEKAVADKQILIGDGTGFTAAALTGDVSMANTGVTTIGSAKVATAMIQDNAVTLDKMADITRGSIIRGSSTGTPEYLAKGSANTVLSSDGTDVSYTQVATAMIADDAVTSAKIAGATIVAGNIANDTITATQIAANAITASELADNAVDTAAIDADAVTPAKISFIDDSLSASVSNTGHILVNDNGQFTNVALSGDLGNNLGAITISDNAITTLKINADAVTNAKIADDAVQTENIVDANVTTAKLADDAVTAAKLADDAVVTASIVDANVTTAKLADDAVTTAKITNLNVTTDKLAADAVTAAKLANNAVDTSAIADLNVTTDKLAADAVTAAKLADSAVVTASSVDGSVTTAKIDNDAVTASKINFIADAAAASNTHMLVANGSAFTNVAMSGNATLANDGALTLANAQDNITSITSPSGNLTLSGATSQSVVIEGVTITDTAITGVTSIDFTDGSRNFATSIADGNILTIGGSDSIISMQDVQCKDITASGRMSLTTTIASIASNNLKIEDAMIALNEGGSSISGSRDGGVVVKKASDSYTGIVYDGADSKWNFYDSINSDVSTSSTASSSTFASVKLGALETSGCVTRSVETFTGNGSLDATNHIAFVNGAHTITLPDSVSGREYIIRNVHASADVTIATSSNQELDGSSSNTTLSAGATKRIIGDGSAWFSI